jgi:cell wall-associated NlpC family hydrolase
MPSPRVEREAPPPPQPVEPFDGPPRPVDGAEAVVRTALTLRGVPYRDGGSTPEGFDCSGFTQWVFARNGTRLPREVREQYATGTPVAVGAQQPGDLIFFTTVAPGASHVGIVIDSDTFVHAPSSRGVVRVEHVSLAYWSRRLVGIRRMDAN